MIKKWISRPYKSGDERGILDLLQTVSLEEQSLDRWRWQYEKNPAGEPVIWVAENGGRIIGHRAYVPALVKFGSNTMIVGQAIDTVVDIEYRRQGIFMDLIQKSLIEAHSRGWAFIYNFPNEYSLPGYLKAGWHKVCQMRRLIKVFRPENVSQAGFGDRFGVAKVFQSVGWIYRKVFSTSKNALTGADLSFKEESCFDTRFDRFWNVFSRYLTIGVIRDSKYLNWRYVKNHENNFTIYSVGKNEDLLGFAVLNCSSRKAIHAGTLKKKLQVGNIVEFLILPNQSYVARTLLIKSISFLNKQNMDIVSCWLSAQSSYRFLFRQQGFFSYPFGMANFVVRPLANISSDTLMDKKKWVLSLGDTDAY